VDKSYIPRYQPALLRLEASANVARDPNVQVVLTSVGGLWLLNRTTSKIDLPPGELFGFNTGTFIEVASGPQQFVDISV